MQQLSRVDHLQQVVLFFDDAEETASERRYPTTLAHCVTNELLKLIRQFRRGERRLLICATSAVRSLDPAFLRPGRFDRPRPGSPRRLSAGDRAHAYLAHRRGHPCRRPGLAGGGSGVSHGRVTCVGRSTPTPP
ncbi:AAA family ATPase [Streptomyces sp. FIT100]|uniref:AAA family ATPase n=1 Tax=Streptomyces sp. FIT100 TaxID=2837956 RepID=UPI0028BDAE6C|nr:AAA family ATPase [Streptomyces sp. FIT100]